jgi:hypothetical protein
MGGAKESKLPMESAAARLLESPRVSIQSPLQLRLLDAIVAAVWISDQMSSGTRRCGCRIERIVWFGIWEWCKMKQRGAASAWEGLKGWPMKTVDAAARPSSVLLAD